MDNILIRKLLNSDGKDVQEIVKLIALHSPDLDFIKITDDESKRPDAVSYVAEIDGKVVGFMISYILRGVFGIDKSAWIAMLGVHPKFMDQGIGKGLAEEIFKIYKEKGIQKIYTSVLWDSIDLLSFFKTLGFDRSRFINLGKTLE